MDKKGSRTQGRKWSFKMWWLIPMDWRQGSKNAGEDLVEEVSWGDGVLEIALRGSPVTGADKVRKGRMPGQAWVST